jgi:hypothetical protein
MVRGSGSPLPLPSVVVPHLVGQAVGGLVSADVPTCAKPPLGRRALSLVPSSAAPRALGLATVLLRSNHRPTPPTEILSCVSTDDPGSRARSITPSRRARRLRPRLSTSSAPGNMLPTAGSTKRVLTATSRGPGRCVRTSSAKGPLEGPPQEITSALPDLARLAPTRPHSHGVRLPEAKGSSPCRSRCGARGGHTPNLRTSVMPVGFNSRGAIGAR